MEEGVVGRASEQCEAERRVGIATWEAGHNAVLLAYKLQKGKHESYEMGGGEWSTYATVLHGGRCKRECFFFRFSSSRGCQLSALRPRPPHLLSAAFAQPNLHRCSCAPPVESIPSLYVPTHDILLFYRATFDVKRADAARDPRPGANCGRWRVRPSRPCD